MKGTKVALDGKLVLGFLADVLYAKEIINHDELMAIYDITDASSLEKVFERIIRGEFSAHRKGEPFADYFTGI